MNPPFYFFFFYFYYFFSLPFMGWFKSWLLGGPLVGSCSSGTSGVFFPYMLPLKSSPYSFKDAYQLYLEDKRLPVYHSSYVGLYFFFIMMYFTLDVYLEGPLFFLGMYLLPLILDSLGASSLYMEGPAPSLKDILGSPGEGHSYMEMPAYSGGSFLFNDQGLDPWHFRIFLDKLHYLMRNSGTAGALAQGQDTGNLSFASWNQLWRALLIVNQGLRELRTPILDQSFSLMLPESQYVHLDILHKKLIYWIFRKVFCLPPSLVPAYMRPPFTAYLI